MSERKLARAAHRSFTAFFACLTLSACDSGPSGGGVLSGSVFANGEAPGSALILFSGPGLVDAEGTGGTLAWVSEPVTGSDELRLLLVDPDAAGALTFELEVRDLTAPLPTITVLQLADQNNVRFTTQDLEIRIRR
jgi:hypothetical protein